MDNPGLLQELLDVEALLSDRGRDGKQAAAADRSLAGLDVMADLALNHRLAQGTYSFGDDFVDGGIVVGSISVLTRQVQRPSASRRIWTDLLAPRCLLAPLVAQLHHPLQRGLKGLADQAGSFVASRAS